MKLFLVLLISPLTALAFTYSGGTFTTDGSRNDVQSAIFAASNNCIVQIPAGTFEWNTNVVVTNGLTLRGAGANSTIIQDNVPATGSWFQQSVVVLSPASNQVSRVQGIRFTRGTRGTTASGGLVYCSGSQYSGYAVVQNCLFTNFLHDAAVFVYGAIGLAASNTFHSSASLFSFYVRHDNWGGLTDADGSWTNGPNWGTDKFFFIEGNQITHASMYDFIDTYGGGRWVARYNSITNGRVAVHGTDSTGRARGGRAFEFYKNIVHGNASTTEQMSVRSGSCLVWSNTLANWNTAFSPFSLKNYRTVDYFSPFGGATGTNGWDLNMATNLDNGTATGGDTVTLVDSGKSWAENQWVSNTLVNLTTQRHSEITSNSATTITFRSSYFNTMTFSAGQTYTINTVSNALDQPGMGYGDLIAIGTPAWPNQVPDPCYEWSNNATGGANSQFGRQQFVIKSGIHYFNDTQAPGYTPYTFPHPLTYIHRTLTATSANVNRMNVYSTQ